MLLSGGKLSNFCPVVRTIPEHLVPALKELMRELIKGNFETLEKDGRAGRLTANELREGMERCGFSFIEIPDEEYDKIEAIRVDSPGEIWWIDLDLWAEGLGRSDLTLNVEAVVKDETVRPRIMDLRVM